MQVSDVMTRDAECTRPEATLQEAAERMKIVDVGSLPVCDDNHLVGVLTDRDIIVRSVAGGHDPCSDRVREVMTPEVHYCFEDADVADAAELMREKQVGQLPVLSRDKRLVGIVALGDLAAEDTGEPMTGTHGLVGSAARSAALC